MIKIKKPQEIKLIHIIIFIIAIILLIMIIRGIVKSHKSNSMGPIDESTSQINQEKEGDRQIEEYVRVLEDGTKLNISEKLNEDKELENLKVTDIQLKYKNGLTKLLAIIENDQDEEFSMTNVEIELLDKEGKVIQKYDGVIEGIKAKSKARLNCAISSDCVNAYNLNIKRK